MDRRSVWLLIGLCNVRTVLRAELQLTGKRLVKGTSVGHS
jgi:hypothetical protein